ICTLGARLRKALTRSAPISAAMNSGTVTAKRRVLRAGSKASRRRSVASSWSSSASMRGDNSSARRVTHGGLAQAQLAAHRGGAAQPQEAAEHQQEPAVHPSDIIKIDISHET